MPDRSDRSSSDSLPDLVDSLETTLRDLRQLLTEERDGSSVVPDRQDMGRRRGPPAPPRMRDILRFTEEYTIPTVIAVLEANIRLLRLMQASLRAVDPERSAFGDARGSGSALTDGVRRAATGAGRASADGLASALDELQRALAESDTPENPEARELLTDARTLSEEIQARIREGRAQADRARNEGNAKRTTDGLGPNAIRIDVRDEADEAEGTGDADTEAAADEPKVDVDVDAELQSIKEQMGAAEGAVADEEVDDSDATGDAEDEGDAADADSDTERKSGSSTDE